MPNLVLTPLESLLIGGFISLVSGLIVKMWLSRRYITRTECASQRELLREHKRNQWLIFAMLREVVLRLPGVNDEDKARILNMRPPAKE